MAATGCLPGLRGGIRRIGIHLHVHGMLFRRRSTSTTGMTHRQGIACRPQSDEHGKQGCK